MSITINSLEIKNLSYKSLRTIMNNQPVEHLEEVPFGDYNLELNLCDEVYIYAEHTGYCHCYAAFVDNEYVGYMIVMASEMIHHKGTLQSVTDSFYIAPAYRSARVFTGLLAAVEQDLKANNIRFFTLGLNPNMPDFAKLQDSMQRKGYQHTEYSVTKEL